MISKIKHYILRIREGRLKEYISQWIWMGRYICKYWVLIGAHTLIGASGSLMALGTALLSRNLVDSVSGDNVVKILASAVGYAGVGLFQLAISAVRSRLSLHITMKVGNKIRSDIFAQILRTEWENLSRFPSGDLMYRINGDTSVLVNNILTYLPNVVSIFVSFGGALWVMLQNDPWMALVALAGAPISFLSTRFSMKKMREFQKKQMELQSHKTVFNQEALQNMQMVKAFGLVEHFIEQYAKVQEQSLDYAMVQNTFQSKMTIVTGLIGQLIGYACYGFAVFRLWQGRISYGTMTMFLSMATSLRSSFSGVLNLFPSAMRACISAGRIMEITCLPRESEAEIQEGLAMLETARKTGVQVQMRDVRAAYGEDDPIYTHADLHAAPGEIIGLIGPSGQGKTTTLRILLGLYRPRSGEVTVSIPGGKVMAVGAGTRCMFSYIPQGNTLFSGTIADNLRMLKPDASDKEIIDALKTADAWEFVSKLEKGIDTYVMEGGGRFSEGQKQRLSIARALLVHAPVILLDEATSALDMPTEKRVLRNILRRDPLQTIIVTAHRPSVLSMCQRVYKVQGGRFDAVDSREIKDFLEGE